MIVEEFPDVILLRQKGDLWWSAATNIGVNYAIQCGATHVMTLNDDTLAYSDYIEEMISSSKKYPNALIGALAIDVNSNKPIFGGSNINWKTGKFESVLERLPFNQRQGMHQVNNFPGRGLLIPVKVFKKIGLFDSKNFPQTIADIDFTVRANNFGFKVFCNYEAKIKIYPEESWSSKLKNKKSLSNYYQHLFGIKGGGNLKWFTLFAFKNAPRIYLFQFLITGLARRVFGYLMGWKTTSSAK